MTNVHAYPLHWPTGYPRSNRQDKPIFKYVTVDKAVTELNRQLRLLGVRPDGGRLEAIISTNIPLRYDGMPRSEYSRSKITDYGVAVYFRLNGNDLVLCCDKFNSVESNVKAIAITSDDMRRIERNGVSDFIKKAFTGFKALPENTREWWRVLGWENKPAQTDRTNWIITKDQYKLLAKSSHPDNGGQVSLMADLNRAMSEAKEYFKNVID
jgi:hypothetical protein